MRIPHALGASRRGVWVAALLLAVAVALGLGLGRVVGRTFPKSDYAPPRVDGWSYRADLALPLPAEGWRAEEIGGKVRLVATEGDAEGLVWRSQAPWVAPAGSLWRSVTPEAEVYIFEAPDGARMVGRSRRAPSVRFTARWRQTVAGDRRRASDLVWILKSVVVGAERESGRTLRA